MIAIAISVVALAAATFAAWWSFGEDVTDPRHPDYFKR